MFLHKLINCFDKPNNVRIWQDKESKIKILMINNSNNKNNNNNNDSLKGTSINDDLMYGCPFVRVKWNDWGGPGTENNFDEVYERPPISWI